MAMVIGRGACLVAILFASGDIWPAVTIGFTFRFSQLCLLIALMTLPALVRRRGITFFPGWQWLLGFLILTTATLPLSLFVSRSIAYVIWAWTDALLIFAFVQFFSDERAVYDLVRFFLVSFVALACFGLLQFCLGVVGINLLVQQWWIEGRLPRINGLSYEPSYYATCLIPGWILAAYLLERRGEFPSRALQKATFALSTLALVLCTSRIGWLLMVAWGSMRGAWALIQILAGRPFRQRWIALGLSTCLMFGLTTSLDRHLSDRMADVASDLSFLLSGVGIFGAASHSADIRSNDLGYTWEAFTDHPVIGTGIGALPVALAAYEGDAMVTLDDAKAHEGMSIFVELLGSTGIVGALLLAGFAASMVSRLNRTAQQCSANNRILLKGAMWSTVWLLLALQFNQNFLRISIFVNLGVLACCILALGRIRPESLRSESAVVSSYLA